MTNLPNDPTEVELTTEEVAALMRLGREMKWLEMNPESAVSLSMTLLPSTGTSVGAWIMDAVDNSSFSSMSGHSEGHSFADGVNSLLDSWS